ncbi:MAG: cadherin-like domain-containing protein, partial [Cyanobacteria bacterium P01_C01_bin.147]
GQFLRLDPSGGDPTPITTFTQADIDAGNLIAFDYFGVDEAPSFLLTVTDEGGKDVQIASSEIFNFLPENAEPVVSNLALIIDEGATVPITADNLLYTDEESAASELTYTVTINNIDPANPQDTDDRFIIDGAVEVGATVTFTQQQINDGVVSFIHGGSNDAPDLTVTLTDTAVGGDANTIAVPLSDAIVFNAENDLPTLETLALTLTEGDTIDITADVLLVKDEESSAADITYTVDAVSGGNFFRLATDPGGDPTIAGTFTQAEIDAGNVLVFEHDGLNDAPTFTLTVSDGTDAIEVTDQSDQGINYTPTNDTPTVVASSFTVAEGDPDNPVAITLTAENLLVEDEESAPEALTYTITITDNDADNPDRFQVDGVIEVGSAVTFTQADINAGLVKFIPGGSNTIATLTTTVTDTFPAEFGEPITIDVPLVGNLDAENDVPIVVNNIILTLSEGETKILSTENLLVEDEETAAEELVYTIDAVTNGTFARRDLDLGTATDIMVGGTFTQAEINAGEIQFVHDGGEAAPTYNLSLVDTPLAGEVEVNTVNIASNIIQFNNLNDDPTLDVNQLTITEGAEITFSAENIAASDPDNEPSELRFNITDVDGGTFTFQGNPLTEDQSFRAADIAFGDLKFQDDGDENPASYTVTVLDPLGGNAMTAANVTLIKENDLPILEVNTFTIKEGDRLVLNDPDPSTGVINLQASDAETPADELIFTFTDINGGTFFDANAQEIAAGTE